MRSIGEASTETDAQSASSSSAIRFCESSGLLAPAGHGANGHRDYPHEALRGVLGDRDEIPHEEVAGTLQGRLVEIDAVRAVLLRQRREVLAQQRELEARRALGACLELPEAGAPSAAARRRKRKARAA